MRQQIKESYDENNLYNLWKVIVDGKMIIIVLLAVAVFSTVIISLRMPKIYRGEVVLNIFQLQEIEEASGKELVQSRGILQPKEIVDMIGNIDRGKMTKIFPTTYESVTDLKLRAIKDSKDKLFVTIEAKNANLIGKALSEIVDYINNFDIVKVIVREEREKLLKRSNELSSVINFSEKLSNNYRELLNEGKLSVVGFNPLDLNKGIVDIKLAKLVVDQRLQRLNEGGIKIADQPYIQNRPVKPKIGLNIVFAGFISVFLGIFLVVLQYRLKRFKETRLV
ncbi:MAG TPA: hypothetical protein VEM40_04550 [Nitrospirota bacterium]|nr:hypothetical protein [Nitrospirota bacterium]